MRILILIALISPLFLYSQPQKIDSLKKRLTTNISVSEVCGLYNQLGVAYMTIGMLNSAQYSFSKSIENNNAKENTIEWAKGLSEIGNILSVKGQHKQGLDTLLLAKDATDLIKSDSKIKIEIRLFKYLGDLYSRAGLYEKSIENLQKSIQLASKADDNNMLAKNYNTLAINYSNLKDYTKAIEYNNKSLDVFKAIDDKIRIANTYSNLATLFKEKGNNDSTIKYNNFAIKIYEEAGYKFGLSSTISLNAEVLKDNGKNNEALTEYKKLLALDSELGMQNNLGYDFQAISFIFQKLKQYDSSNFYFKKSIINFNEAEMRKELTTSYDALIQNYLQINKNDSAFKYYNMFNDANEAFLNDEKITAISTAEIKYETALKEETIAKQKIEIKTQKQKNFWLITGSAIAALVAFILGWFYKRIRRQKKQIEIQKQEILHNNRNNIQQLISIFNRQSETEGLKENSLSNQERLYTLNLLNKLLYESGENNKADLKEYLTQLSSAKEIASGKLVKIKLDTPNIKLKSNLLKDIGLIVNELTTNAIKYAFKDNENPLIAIKVNYDDAQNINLHIADNGNGLPESFNLLQERKSFGLEFVNDLVTQQHGTIRAYNNNGSCFDISLKVR